MDASGFWSVTDPLWAFCEPPFAFWSVMVPNWSSIARGQKTDSLRIRLGVFFTDGAVLDAYVIHIPFLCGPLANHLCTHFHFYDNHKFKYLSCFSFPNNNFSSAPPVLESPSRNYSTPSPTEKVGRNQKLQMASRGAGPHSFEQPGQRRS